MTIAPPNITDYNTFITNVMGIVVGPSPPVPPTQLVNTDPVIAMSFEVAMDIVNDALSMAGPSVYPLAVYNFAGDRLMNYALDWTGAPAFQPNPPAQNNGGLAFFAYMRMQFNISGFVGGVIQSSSDQGTGQSMVVPDAMRLFTMGDLQSLKTPWGRQYMAFAQDYGYLVGLT